MVALLHGAHRAVARILVPKTAEHVVQEALAHRAVRDAHFLHPQHAEHFRKDRESPGEYRPAILGDGFECEFAGVAGIHAVLNRTVDAGRRDGVRLRVKCVDDLADRAHGAGTAGRALPAAAAEGGLHRFELQPCGEPRALETPRGDLAVTEEAFT